MRAVLATAWYRLLRRVGSSGLLGLALLLAGAALAVWTPRLQRDTLTIQQRAALARQSLAQVTNAPDRGPSRHQRLSEFATGLPPSAQVAADLKQVFAAAQRHAVALNKGEYQLKAEPNSQFIAYAATFPVKERYSSIKTFVAEVLDSLPYASLDDLHLERGEAGATVVDARIRFVFVYRAH